MSNRFLSLLLGLLLLVAVVFALVLLVEGPRQIEDRTIDLVESEQRRLAEQAAASIEHKLNDIETHLMWLANQRAAEIHRAQNPDELERALGRLSHATDRRMGVTLLVQETDGTVLAIDPHADEEDKNSIMAATAVVSQPSWLWPVADNCKGCVGEHQRIRLIAPLDEERLLAASVDLERLGDRTLGPLSRGERDVRATLTTERGRELYASGVEGDREADWLVAEVAIADTDWHVEVATPREAVAPKVRERTSTLWFSSYALVALMLGGLILVGWSQRREHERRLEQTRALAHQDKLATVGMLAASASHEIRNAIAAAQLKLQVAEEEAEAEVADDVASAAHSVDRLAQLAQNLGGYAGKRDDEEWRFELTEVVDEALDVVKPKLEPNATVDVQMDDGAFVYGTKGPLVQVLVNLLLNAYEAASEKDEPHIEVQLLRGDNEAVLVVADNGPGIDEEALDHIFEPFFTTKGDESHGGSGIGLWLSSRIIGQHGGVIEADNAPEGGARVVVRLPLHREGQEPPPARGSDWQQLSSNAVVSSILRN